MGRYVHLALILKGSKGCLKCPPWSAPTSPGGPADEVVL
jgi:hypothetical protein